MADNEKTDVEGGKTFSEALKKHPNVFDPLFVNLVAAGEMGGMLDVTLNRLAAYIEKVERLKKKVKGAMTYPAVVVGIALLVVVNGEFFCVTKTTACLNARQVFKILGAFRIISNAHLLTS